MTTTDRPDHPLVLQQPAQPAQLFLLLHGLGATPADLAPLGSFLAGHFPQACIVSLPAPEACDFTALGRQWFSTVGIDDDARPARVNAALPAFEALVRHWQQVAGLGPEATALVGFSQGAIMALASTQRGLPTLAARVIGIAGRFPQLPEHSAAADTTFHLVHGKHDAVIPYAHAVSAAERLIALGGDVTADVLPFVGHEITDEMLEIIHERLTTHVPRRIWDAAMQAAAASGDLGPGH